MTAEQERAAVVTWLRSEAEAGQIWWPVGSCKTVERLADAIERGEHRKGQHD